MNFFSIKMQSDINANWIEDPLTIKFTKWVELCRRIIS